MHIFIDESGTFVCDSISAVGALVIPDSRMAGFEKLYGRLRKHLPMDKGEVKGKLLTERQVADVVRSLRQVGGILEIVTIDAGTNPPKVVEAHRMDQAERLTRNLTDEHHPSMIENISDLRRQLEAMPNQLYMQSCAMGEKVRVRLEGPRS